MSKIRDVWQASLSEIPKSSQIVEALLRSGGRCLGLAHTEPIPFSLIELNTEVFRNPEKDGTLTGGSYSGCAVMVRASLTDFALGVDTVGEFRMAAVCCGVIGFKPTSGSVLLNGIATKSDALDTVGFLTEKAHYLGHIGEMMDLPGQRYWRGGIKIFMAKDLFDYWMRDNGKDAFYAVARAALKFAGDEHVEEIDLSDFLSNHATGWSAFNERNVYEALRKVAITIADYELKIKMSKNHPSSLHISQENGDRDRYRQALDVRACVQEAFKQGIHEGQYIMLPSMFRPVPYRSADCEHLERFTISSQRLYTLASLVGCPHLVYPLRTRNGNTYSVSILAVHRADKHLLTIGHNCQEKYRYGTVDIGEKLIPLTQKMIRVNVTRSMDVANQEVDQLDEAKSKRWQEIGNRCHNEGNYEEAIVAYTQAVECCPHLVVNFTSRALMYLKQKQYEEAEEDCCKALAMEPDNSKAWLYRGQARKEMYMYLDAQEDLEMVLALDPDNPDVYTELQDLERIISQL